jgi:hypothetical protein
MTYCSACCILLDVPVVCMRVNCPQKANFYNAPIDINNEKPLYANFRSARMVTLLKVEVNEGEGTTNDPIHRVAYLIVPKTGAVLAKIGEVKDRQFSDGNDEIIPLE